MKDYIPLNAYLRFPAPQDLEAFIEVHGRGNLLSPSLISSSKGSRSIDVQVDEESYRTESRSASCIPLPSAWLAFGPQPPFDSSGSAQGCLCREEFAV